jgi:hypothetical protein
VFQQTKKKVNEHQIKLFQKVSYFRQAMQGMGDFFGDLFKDKEMKLIIKAVGFLILLFLLYAVPTTIYRIFHHEHVKLPFGFEYFPIDNKSDFVKSKDTVRITEYRTIYVRAKEAAVNGKNVNTGTNNGYIGDNGQILAIQQRHLTPQLWNRITSTIKNKRGLMGLFSLSNDKESETFRNEIGDKLIASGYFMQNNMAYGGTNTERLYDTTVINIASTSIYGDGTKDTMYSIVVYPATNTR